MVSALVSGASGLSSNPGVMKTSLSMVFSSMCLGSTILYCFSTYYVTCIYLHDF